MSYTLQSNLEKWFLPDIWHCRIYPYTHDKYYCCSRS